jgi:glc operon protein GlcG
MSLRGGMPIVVNGEVVGAVGVAGRNKETDADIAKEAADVVGSRTAANEPEAISGRAASRTNDGPQ